MSLFKKNKPTMIPLLQEPEDKMFNDIKRYKENEELDEPEDMDFPLQSEDIYLKIDEMNELTPINENYIKNIYETIGTYREGEPARFETLLKNVKEIFEQIGGSYNNLFDFSYKMSKKLEVTKEQIETCYEVLLNKKNATTLDLDAYTLSALGRMVSYSYTKLDQFKIKDMTKLEESIAKIIDKKINIYDEFVKWCIKENKDPKKEKITEYYKKRRKDYDCLPEVIFLVNHFSSITTVNLELDKIYNQEFSEEEYKYFEIGVLNIHWILRSLENIKFNLICREMQRTLFKRYKEKIIDTCNKNNDVLKPKDLILDNPIFFRKKSNFSHQLKPIKFICENEANDVTLSKTVELKEKKTLFSTKTIGKALKSIKTISENILNLGKEKSAVITRTEIVRQNLNFFEFIIICIFSLNEAKQGINVELTMNDTFNGEFFLLLKDIYKFEWIPKEDSSQFHLLDLLIFNKIIYNVQKLDIEINCLDFVTFNKFLSFFYFNQATTKFNMSLFSSDFIYTPEFIYKIYSEIYLDKSAENLKGNYEADTYLFCDIKDLEDKILDRLFPNFQILLSTLFEIIYNRKKLTEIGFNIDAPKNIINKSKYMNSIYKFILNLLFYVSKNNINKFAILSPSTEFNSCIKPEIDEVIKGINFNQKNNLEELAMQVKFYELESINCFITDKLRVLNIGNLDLKTLEYLCKSICSYKFNTSSKLEQLSIGLSETVTEFSEHLKKLLYKLFNIKINNLTSLTLLTNLDLSDEKEYSNLLKLLNYNWISSYVITFSGGEEFNTDESSSKLQYIVPSNLGTKLLDKRSLKKIENHKDTTDSAFWYLRYKLRDKKVNKKIIFDILKFINIVKSPKLSHYYANKN
jgi:hypothetical protein